MYSYCRNPPVDVKRIDVYVFKMKIKNYHNGFRNAFARRNGLLFYRYGAC